MRRCLPMSVSSTWMISLPSSPGLRAASVTSATLPRTKLGAFLEQPLVKLIVGFVRRAHIDVEICDLRPGALFHQVGKLKALHAADAGAVVVVVLVTAADAMDDPDGFRRRYAIAQDDFAIRRTSSVGQPLELQAGEDVRQAPIAVLLDLACIEEIETRRQDDIADLDSDVLIFLGEIDGARWGRIFHRLCRCLFGSTCSFHDQ